MQLVQTVLVKKSCCGNGGNIRVKSDGKSRIDKQKEKNLRISYLTQEYNELAKNEKLNESEILRAKEILMELRGLGLFCKLVRI